MKILQTWEFFHKNGFYWNCLTEYGKEKTKYTNENKLLIWTERLGVIYARMLFVIVSDYSATCSALHCGQYAGSVRLTV